MYFTITRPFQTGLGMPLTFFLEVDEDYEVLEGDLMM
jgi:hypothetical protein